MINNMRKRKYKFVFDWERVAIVFFLLLGSFCFWYSIWHALVK